MTLPPIATVPIRYTLSKDRFSLLHPMTLSLIPNIPEEAGPFRVSFAPPGCNDVQVVEGMLEKVRIYIRDENNANVPGWGYLINQYVFLLTYQPVDDWINTEFQEHGAITDFSSIAGIPCWMSLGTLWRDIYPLDRIPIEIELVSFYGQLRLRHGHHGRTIDVKDIIKH